MHQRVCQHLASVSLQLGDAASAQLYQESAARALPDLAWPDPLLAEILELEVGRQPRMARAEKAEAAGRFDEAAQLLRELVAKAPTPANQVILGIMLVRAKRYAEAEPVLETTLRLEPANLQAHYYLAVSRFFRAEKLPPDSNDAKELYRQTVESADKVVELKADHAYGYVFRGQALRRLGRKAEGLAELRRAAQIRGEMADVHRQLAKALIEDGAIEEGTRSLETVLRLEPGDAGSRALLEKHRRPE